jgi:hypothetical protein
MGAPRPGPCAPWVSDAQIAALVPVQAAAQQAIGEGQLSEEQVSLICAAAAAAASEILYELSGRVFTGECGPVTIRPVARPSDIDTRSWGATLSPLGWFSSWGLSTSYGSSVPGIMAHYGSSDPPVIRLPWPVLDVLQVKIDGVVIPGPFDSETQTGEWELRGHQELVRIRPTASFSPTQRWGWPTTQIGDLPDTEEGTFSITFTFGQPPPASGLLAALKLGEYLALPQLGDTTRYPQRVVQITRQGVSTQVASVIDILQKGSLGIWEVDAFLLAVNPHKNLRQAAVWSPDMGRPRRQATPSLPS